MTNEEILEELFNILRQVPLDVSTQNLVNVLEKVYQKNENIWSEEEQKNP